MDKNLLPYILVVTSKEDKNIISSQIKGYFDEKKTHYVVTMNEKNYLFNSDFEFLNKMFTKSKSLKSLKKSEKDSVKKKLKGQCKRIVNGIKRFSPMAIVCPTVYGLLSAVEAKKQGEIDIPLISVIPSFTLDKTAVSDRVDYYIVENEDIKNELTSFGIMEDSIKPFGVAIAPYNIAEEKKGEVKEKLGLKDVPTVFVTVEESRDSLEAIDMLFDQGDIINIVAYIEDKKLLNRIRKMVELKSCDNVQLFDKLSLYNEYLSVSDILITNYDPSTIYKAFMASKAVIAFSPLNENQKNDIEYLDNNHLIAYAESPQDVINRLYDLLQTELKDKLIQNTNKRINKKQLNTICDFIASQKNAGEYGNNY